MSEGVSVPEVRSSVPQGRDFLAATKDLQREDQREAAMQPGDFIEVPWALYRTWYGDKENRDFRKRLPDNGIAIVNLVRVERNEKTGGSDAIVEAGGIERRIHPSLFYNYRSGPRHDMVILGSISKG